jgi:hypothetical protein
MSNLATRASTDRIRLLNDNFRCTYVGGHVVMTQGVNALPIDRYQGTRRLGRSVLQQIYRGQ